MIEDDTLKNRVGTFKISSSLVMHDPNLVMEIMGQVIVVRAEHLYEQDAIRYIALSPNFDVVPRGQIPIEYVPCVENMKIKWEKYGKVL